MMNFFVGDNVNNPSVLIAFGSKEATTGKYTGREVKERYSFEYFKEALKWLKKIAKYTMNSFDEDTVYWIVNLKTNRTLYSGVNTTESLTRGYKALEKYCSEKGVVNDKISKYTVRLSINGDIEVNVEAQNVAEACEKAVLTEAEFSKEDVLNLRYIPLRITEENGSIHFV